MTRKGANIIIENLSLRIFEIEEREARLAKEKAEHRVRIQELRQTTYEEDVIKPLPVITIG